MKKTILKQYARLIVRKGVNLQKGQIAVVSAQPDQPDFVYMVVEEAYRAGASRVFVEMNYLPIQKLHVRYQTVKRLGTMEDWELAKLKASAEQLPAMIHLVSADPDGLNGMNQAKNAKAMQLRYPIIKPILDSKENKYQWCIAAVPGKAWAKKVFPGLRASVAEEKLWKAILDASRVNDDPIEAWNRHNADLAARCKYLNDLHIETLEYKASNGTDFKVGLIEDALFMGGEETALGSGIPFNPNIPSEEVFVSPKKGVAEGIVYSTKPLSYRGFLIENFSIRFENGRAVEVHAEKGEEALKEMISLDDGAAMLGECALIPHDSPISNSGLIFSNTLFDENASCHLALGMGFANCIQDYSKYTLEECRAKGINDSMIHEDFMIGTPDMDIWAVTRSGDRVQIFKNGNWAF